MPRSSSPGASSRRGAPSCSSRCARSPAWDAFAQLRGWAADHDAGFEFRSSSAAEVEAKVKAPVVDMKNFGLSASYEVEQQFVTRWEPASGKRAGSLGRLACETPARSPFGLRPAPRRFPPQLTKPNSC